MSYIKPQLQHELYARYRVVYLLCPTSNHNSATAGLITDGLYIFYVLHQTTTVTFLYKSLTCCISFMSYIKPQPC